MKTFIKTNSSDFFILKDTNSYIKMTISIDRTQKSFKAFEPLLIEKG